VADGGKRASPLLGVGLAFVLAGSLAVALRLTEYAAHAESAPPPFAAALPYAVIDPQLGPPTAVHLALLALGALQAFVLFRLYRALRERSVPPLERALLAIPAALMLIVALGAHAVSGFDTYAYAGYAQLPNLAQAYAPPPTRLPGTFGVVNDVWGTPLVPCYYGPLWVVLSQLVAGHAGSLGAAIFALRLLEVPALVGMVVVLAVWKREPAPVALLALNPAIYSLYVANAHNDLLAVALLLAATALARRAPLAAALGVTAAALIKIPFVVAALYVFAGRGDLPRRLLWIALTAALALGLSLAFGGKPYFADLVARVHQTTASSGLLYVLTARVIKAGLVLVALVALLTVFLRSTVWRTAGWSFITLGSLTYPWYLIWPLPYAALERRALVWFLVPLPVVAAALEPAFPHLGLGQAMLLVLLVAAAYELLRARPLPVEE